MFKNISTYFVKYQGNFLDVNRGAHVTTDPIHEVEELTR